MAYEEWLDATSEWTDSEGWDGPGFYVVDANGILAGPFAEEGEGQWWLEKSVRI